MYSNRRVLHGREGFDPNSGERHLQVIKKWRETDVKGVYVDLDEFYSKYRIYLKKFGYTIKKELYAEKPKENDLDEE